MYEPGPSRRRGETDALSRFLDYLREIDAALNRRDSMRVTALLRKRTATHLPREIREELLMLVRSSRDTLRAPVQFLRFQHRMRQLSAAGESLPRAQTELELGPPAVDGIARRSGADERPAASESIEDF